MLFLEEITCMSDLILTPIPLSELKLIISESIRNEFTNQNSIPIAIEEADPLLKINDVCKLLSVSRVTIHNWKQKGILPFHRISRKIYFRKSEVFAALKLAKNKFADSEGGA
jgi:excisionase family DNA binding protein